MNAIARQFSRDKYVVLRSILDPSRIKSLHDHTMHLLRACKWGDDTQVPNAPSLYAEPLMERVLLDLAPRIEDATGLRLHPTYSYLRVYPRGSVLARHFDRPACEISVSLNLGYEADGPWPLCLEPPSGIHRIALEPGSALLYRGTECPHWRETFGGQYHAQAMFHYVDQEGPHASWKFDRRESLGLV